MPFSRTIIDDRGRDHQLPAPGHYIEVARADSGEAAAMEIYGRLEGGRWVFRGLAVLWAAYMTVELAMAVFFGGVAWWRLLPGVLVLVLLVALLRRQPCWLMRRHPDDLRYILLQCGRCPGCGYMLRDSAAESDGLRVCPECGAAWAMARRSRPTSPPGTRTPAGCSPPPAGPASRC